MERWRERLLAALAPAEARPDKRASHVRGLTVRAGRASGSVQGAGASPYFVELLVDTLTDAQWQQAVDLIAGQARFLAAVHAGRLTDELADALQAAGADPAAVTTLDPRCPCGGPQPCRHVGALWQAVAEEAAGNAFTLLRLRGRGRQQLLADLGRRRRADRPDHEPAHDLAPESWWEPAEPPVEREALAPVADAPALEGEDPGSLPLALLGDPEGWKGPADAATTFAPLVRGAATRAEGLRRRAAAGHLPSTDEAEVPPPGTDAAEPPAPSTDAAGAPPAEG